MSTAYTAKFSTNFQGMGLPTPVFAEYTQLFRNISSSTAHCRPNADGSCMLDELCENYDYLEQYSFQIAFESDPNMHMNVPLAAFAINEGGRCMIMVTNLDIQQLDSQNVIMGGMFFQEFYGAFTNTYDVATGLQKAQTLELFL